MKDYGRWRQAPRAILSEKTVKILTDLSEPGQSGYGITALSLAEIIGVNYSELVKHFEEVADKVATFDHDFVNRNFGTAMVAHDNGEEIEDHIMTKQGALLVLMGFSTEEALKLKLAMVKALKPRRKHAGCRKQ